MLVSSHVLAEVSQTADDVVVINRGRSVAQAPLQEIMARSGGGMRVAGPDVAPARDLLTRPGREGHRRPRRRSSCTSRSGEDIGRVVAEHQLVISELSPAGASLEEIYFELTDAHGRPVMIRLIAAELFKLRTTRTFYCARRRRARLHRC